MTWCSLLPLLTLTASTQGLSVVSPACARCVQPEFPPGSGRALYLPHCVQGVTHNYCDAVCSGEQVGSVNKGSCEGCEARCGMVFRPVCSGDQATVYANKCQAECAGVTDTTECQGMMTVIPGKTKLPPTHLLPAHLQSFVPVDNMRDEDV